MVECSGLSVLVIYFYESKGLICSWCMVGN